MMIDVKYTSFLYQGGMNSNRYVFQSKGTKTKIVPRKLFKRLLRLQNKSNVYLEKHTPRRLLKVNRNTLVAKNNILNDVLDIHDHILITLNDNIINIYNDVLVGVVGKYNNRLVNEKYVILKCKDQDDYEYKMNLVNMFNINDIDKPYSYDIAAYHNNDAYLLSIQHFDFVYRQKIGKLSIIVYK